MMDAHDFPEIAEFLAIRRRTREAITAALDEAERAMLAQRPRSAADMDPTIYDVMEATLDWLEARADDTFEQSKLAPVDLMASNLLGASSNRSRRTALAEYGIREQEIE